ncbi:MAG: hypothetical protein IJ566_07420 [Cardiobacteriaceae bacterium]|nr:hypothetical protein [Cardiobacteriaceae bacterium]
MTKDEFKQYVLEGHDIEWRYNNIGFGMIPKDTDDDGNDCISVYQAKTPPIHYVYSFEELINVKFYGVTVMEMLESLGDEEEAEKRGDLVIF